MDQQQQSRWRLSSSQVLWAVVIGIALVVLIRIGYAYQWTGFGQLKLDEDVQLAKTLWDWLDLLIVPVVLAIGGYLFTRAENSRTQDIARQQRQDDVLQAYLDGMSQLLTDKERPLRMAQMGDNLSTVARARTLTALARLAGNRKRSALQFLYESDLITNVPVVSESRLIESPRPVVDLRGADLSKADLSAPMNLTRAYLSAANLNGADLSGAVLIEAYLGAADLSGADLSGSLLSRAHLSAANLNGADLSESILSGAILWLADLREVNLGAADLSGADLSKADLSGAKGITNEILAAQAESLMGATMPNGQKYEDWRKDKESYEDEENNDPS